MRRLPLAAIWLVALLLVPGVAALLGTHQPLLENRERIAYPDLNRGTLRRQETFDQIDRALRDRLPLRGDAIDANARIDIDLLRDSPNPDVAIGGGGWLFYVPELRACGDQPPAADPADAAEILARALIASGRRTIVTVPGGKFSMQREEAPDVDAAKQACVRALERRVGARLAATPGGLDIDRDLAPLLGDGEPVFLRGDTHWASRARERFVRRVLDGIRPGLAEETGVARGREIDRPADLWKLVGLERTDRDAVVVARRAPASPPPDVLLVGDSQLGFAFAFPPAPGISPVLGRALPGGTYCTVDDTSKGLCDEQMVRARTVVFEAVGRNLRQLTEMCWRPVYVAARTLGGTPTRLMRLDDGATDPDGGVTIPPGAAVAARAGGRSAGARSVPRLLLVPVEQGVVTLTQRPRGGGPAPCATPSAQAGGVLALPIPAGRAAGDLQVELSAPDGARLGPPREVLLDDAQPPVSASAPSR